MLRETLNAALVFGVALVAVACVGPEPRPVTAIEQVTSGDRDLNGTPIGIPRDPAAVGYLNLHKRHPDGEEGPEEFKTYSADKALQRLTQMSEMLESFRKLTDRTREGLSPAELEAIGNTARDMQTIGFHNIPLTIEGTILKQEYQVSQLRYELALMQRKAGTATSQELERAKTEYEGAARALQGFWDKRLPTD